MQQTKSQVNKGQLMQQLKNKNKKQKNQPANQTRQADGPHAPTISSSTTWIKLNNNENSSQTKPLEWRV